MPMVRAIAHDLRVFLLSSIHTESSFYFKMSPDMEKKKQKQQKNKKQHKAGS